MFGSDDYWKWKWAEDLKAVDLLDENIKDDMEKIKKIKSRQGKMAPAPFPSMLAILI